MAGSCAVLLLVLALYGRARRAQHRTLLGAVVAPSGPGTTLCVSDIQDSTKVRCCFVVAVAVDGSGGCKVVVWVGGKVVRVRRSELHQGALLLAFCSRSPLITLQLQQTICSAPPLHHPNP